MLFSTARGGERLKRASVCLCEGERVTVTVHADRGVWERAFCLYKSLCIHCAFDMYG